MALSASRDTLLRNIKPCKVSIPLKANAKVWKGGLVGVDATGMGVDGATATGYQVVLIATADADNTGGADAAISVDCYEAEAYLVNSGTDACDATCLGNHVWVQDDQTVAKTNGTSTRSIAGRCTGFDSGGVWVRVGFDMTA